jgi:hypothetical protein
MTEATQLSQDQFKRLRRLSAIFMPYAAKQIDETYDIDESWNFDNRSARFVHYTTADAALKIIKTKRVWMRNALCMADYREVQHGFDILHRYFADQTRIAPFYQAIDLCWPDAAREAITLFNGWLPDILANTYIASLSKHDDSEDSHGRLSMWRGFGSSIGPRVAIVLQIPSLTSGADFLNILFSPVAYLNEEKAHEVLEAIVTNVRREVDFLKSFDRQTIIASIFNMLVAAVACLKHEGFKEEAEWRAIYSPNRVSSPFMASSTEIVGGVPQLVFSVPLDKDVSTTLADLDFARLFDRLIIGPSQYPTPMWMAFVGALKEAGVADADKRMCASGIPIRG